MPRAGGLVSPGGIGLNPAMASKRERLLELVRRQSLLSEGAFRLVSGASSSYFFDMKKTMFDPEGAALVADLLFDMIKDEEVDFIGGIETGAIPIVAALCRRSWPEKPIRGFFVRKAVKDHGTSRRIDGYIEKGARVVLFDDVTTTGGSVMAAVEAAREAGCTILKVVTIVDRLEGAAENFAKAGIRFEALLTRRDFE
jgi:orotate phosphoribosyltransferase